MKESVKDRMSLKSGPKRFRQLLNQPGIIRSLGAHDVFMALIVEQAGFETVFVGGFGTSAALLGLPALNFLTMSEIPEGGRRLDPPPFSPPLAARPPPRRAFHNITPPTAAFH